VTDYRKAILDELRASRKIVRGGHEVTPRFIVYTPTGRFMVIAPLPADEDARKELFRVLRLFLVWKAATAFILSGELNHPDAITSVFVSRDDSFGARQDITREPLTYSDPIWYGRDDVVEDIVDVMPAKAIAMTAFVLVVMMDFEKGEMSELTWFALDE
jgi:hypothetical protein